MRTTVPFALALLVVVTGGCGSYVLTPPSAQPAEPGSDSARSEARSSRVLQVITRGEPNNLSLKFPTAAAAGTNDAVKRLFNAYLALEDERQSAHPYLA